MNHLAIKHRVTIQKSPIPIASIRENRPQTGADGAYVAFEGIVRDHNDGHKVVRLEYECYEALASKEITVIMDEAIERFGVSFVEVVHRIGALMIGDAAVFVQVLAPHRREAFEAAQYVMDELKQRAPIWKKEFYHDGSHAWPRCQHHHHPVVDHQLHPHHR